LSNCVNSIPGPRPAAAAIQVPSGAPRSSTVLPLQHCPGVQRALAPSISGTTDIFHALQTWRVAGSIIHTGSRPVSAGNLSNCGSQDGCINRAQSPAGMHLMGARDAGAPVQGRNAVRTTPIVAASTKHPHSKRSQASLRTRTRVHPVTWQASDRCTAPSLTAGCQHPEVSDRTKLSLDKQVPNRPAETSKHWLKSDDRHKQWGRGTQTIERRLLRPAATVPARDDDSTRRERGMYPVFSDTSHDLRQPSGCRSSARWRLTALQESAHIAARIHALEKSSGCPEHTHRRGGEESNHMRDRPLFKDH
jgi:hypothetical protein